MNTNNAPERIDLRNGWYFTNRNVSKIYLYDSTGRFETEWPIDVAQDFAAAMQPQVSNGDEAVFASLKLMTDLYVESVASSDYFHGSHEDVEDFGSVKQARAILAKHRQPAAVSADAVELARYFATSWLSLSEKDIAGRIQAYGDACRLDGARKMQEAAARKIEPKHKAMSDEAKKAHAEMRKYAESIRALSPETVCGGE